MEPPEYETQLIGSHGPDKAIAENTRLCHAESGRQVRGPRNARDPALDIIGVQTTTPTPISMVLG